MSIAKQDLKFRKGNIRLRYSAETNRYENINNNTQPIELVDASVVRNGNRYIYSPITDNYIINSSTNRRQLNLFRTGQYVVDPFRNALVGLNTQRYQKIYQRVVRNRNLEGNILNQNALKAIKSNIPEYEYSNVTDPTNLTIRSEFYKYNVNLHFNALEDYIRLKVEELGERLNVPNAKFAIIININDVRGQIARQSHHNSDINVAINEIIGIFVDNEEKYEDDYNFTLTSFEIKVLHLRPNSQRGSGGRSIISAKKLWKITSLKTIKNCFLQNIAFLDGETDNEKLNQKAKNMKRKLGLSGHDSIGYEDVVKVSNKKNYNFKVYDNNFDLMWDVQPVEKIDKKGRKTTKVLKLYEMQLRNGHFIALQRWKDIKEDSPIESAEIVEINDDKDMKIIKKNHIKITGETGDFQWVKKTVNEDLRFVCWDLEATPYKTVKDLKNADKSKVKSNDFKPFLAGFAYHKDFKRGNEVVFHQFKGENCIRDMFDFVYENPETFKNTTWYAHNGGTFDLPISIKYGLLKDNKWHINGKKFVELNNAWINLYISAKEIKGFTMVFKDSLRMLPSSLKSLCKSFKVDVPKMDLDHDKVCWENWENFYDKNNGYEYHKVDCTSLLEIMTKFSKTIHDVSGLNLTACMTGASLAKKTFFKNFYENNIYSMSKEHDEYIRKSFYGGRCEAHYLGKLPSNNIYYYDFTSLHPASGLEYLPKGQTVEYSKEDMDEWRKKDPNMLKFFGFIKCIVHSVDTSMIPLHGNRVDGKLVFAHYENGQEMTLTSAEIVTGLKSGMYKYEFLSGYGFDKGKIMAKFFSEYFKMKKTAGINKEHALKYALKIIINSAYGFWGINTVDRDGLFLHDNKEQFDIMMSQNKVKSWGTIADKFFVRGSGDLPITDFNVGISSFISSYSRIKIWELMQDIKKRNGVVYYCDTDSVICNFNLRSDKDMMVKYCPDGKGLELGTLKNEALDVVEDYYIEKYGKKEGLEWMEKQKIADDGEFKFDNGVVLGCKFYALKKSMIDGGTVEIKKCKGYNQSADSKYGNEPLSWGKFTGLAEELKSKGEIPLYNFKNTTFLNSIVQKQKQWLRPKSNFTSETGHMGINLKNIEKKFNPIYTKGLYNHVTGFITPLVF